jgi:hypothetical protein
MCLRVDGKLLAKTFDWGSALGDSYLAEIGVGGERVQVITIILYILWRRNKHLHPAFEL